MIDRLALLRQPDDLTGDVLFEQNRFVSASKNSSFESSQLASAVADLTGRRLTDTLLTNRSSQ
jgi:hypothetical protein